MGLVGQQLQSQKKGNNFNSGKITIPIKTSSSDFKTSKGLQSFAEQKGLQSQISRIPIQGESPKKIFSGGIIMDTFDILNSAQYAVTGLIKGKGVKEGLRTRQSFSDEDSLGKYGIPGVVAGIALDIAVDPFTYTYGAGLIGKAGKVLKLNKGAQKTAKVASRIPVPEYVQKGLGKVGIAGDNLSDALGSALIYRYGQDKVYKELAERSIKNVAIQNRQIVDMIKPIAKLGAKEQQEIAALRKIGQFGIKSQGNNLSHLTKLSPDTLKLSQEVFTKMDQLSLDAIKFLNLPKHIEKAYKANIGSYVKRAYLKYDLPDAKKIADKMFPSRQIKIDPLLNKARKDLPEELRTAWGEILEAGYPTAKAMVQLNKSVENAKFFKEVSTKFSKIAAQDGFSKLPDSKALGELAGKFVPTHIANDLNSLVSPKSFGSDAVGLFKFSKVILNPATHVRNMMSNFVLNNFEGMNPLNPKAAKAYAIATKELAKKGKWYKEATKHGLGLDNFAANELKQFITSPEVTALGKSKNVVKNALNKIAHIYEKEEQFAKLSQYIYQRTAKKVSPEKAWEVAERATFNYAQVTPFIRKMREAVWGYPFITFTYKATPQIAKTAVTHPTRISNIGKIKQGIENLSNEKETARERASEPDWVRNGFYLKLPGKDSHGRSPYLDLTYILPFGDLATGQIIQRGVDSETGLREGPAEAVVGKLAIPNIVNEITKNQDFFGNKIFKDSDSPEKIGADIFTHLLKFYLPPTISAQLPGGYRSDGSRKQSGLSNTIGAIDGGGSQSRTYFQELLSYGGVKINPVDVELQEAFKESNKKKALKTILMENGYIKEMPILFENKDNK